MIRRLSAFSILCVLIVLVCAIAVHTGSLSATDKVEDTRERIIRSSCSGSPDDFEIQMNQFLLSRATPDLIDLVCDSNDTIALYSGWERVLRSVPDRKDRVIIKIDEQAVSRFLGLIEGRIRAPIPAFWETALNSATDYGDLEIGFFSPGFFKKLSRQQWEFKREVDIWNIYLGNQSITFSTPDHAQSVDNVAAHFAGESAYVALYAGRPIPYNLFAVNRQDNKIRWSAKVWAGGNRIYTGFGLHYSELRLVGRNILVFGASEGTAYIEGFDSITGINVFRFNTSYVDVRACNKKQ